MAKMLSMFSDFMARRSYGVTMAFADSESAEKVKDMLSIKEKRPDLIRSVSKVLSASYMSTMMTDGGAIGRFFLDVHAKTAEYFLDAAAYFTENGETGAPFEKAFSGFSKELYAVQSLAVSNQLRTIIRGSEHEDELEEKVKELTSKA